MEILRVENVENPTTKTVHEEFNLIIHSCTNKLVEEERRRYKYINGK